MKKQKSKNIKFRNIKKDLSILLLILYMVSVISVAVSTGHSNSKNTSENKDGEKPNGKINMPAGEVKSNAESKENKTIPLEKVNTS